jgi:hypothetical protein
MNINEYINFVKNNIVPQNELPEVKLNWDFQEMGSMLLKKPLNIVPIYSSDVFPEIICLNSDYYLLWDYKFWEFYDTYLFGAAYFNQTNTDLITEVSVVLQNMFVEFLMYKLEKYPGLSFCLANDIIPIDKKEIMNQVKTILDKRFVSPVEMTGVLWQSRYYVCMHEIFHMVYRENPKRLREVITTIQFYTKMLLDNKDIKLFVDEFDDDSRTIYTDAFYSIINETDVALLEELACDFQAFINLHEIFKRFYAPENLLQSISDLQESMRLCLTFQNEVTYLYALYNEAIKHFTQNSKRHIPITENSSDTEKDDFFNSYQDKIDLHRKRAVARNAIFFQLVMINCYRKYKIYSPLGDILSNIKVRNLLFPISHNLQESDYSGLTISKGYSLMENSKLNPLQFLEARDNLFWIKNTNLNNMGAWNYEFNI